jgi:putative methionine-R-sulfoxide reductase with GAF domain
MPRRAVHTPAYASLNGSSQSAPVELCEILNISESGTCIQAPGPMKVNRLLPLVLDLSETGARIHTAAHVVWAEASGKTGIRFPELPEVSLLQLQQWLEANDAAAKASAAEERVEAGRETSPKGVQSRPNSASSYTSLVAEWAEIQKDVDLFGPNLEGGLQLVAERALALTWANGAALALKQDDGSTDLVCVARAGHDSPEVGARLDTKSGVCGESIRSGTTIKCDDTETDPRVERESFRARGIRSLIACPVKTIKGEMIGVLEVFSSEPAAFWDNDCRTLERLARIVARAVGLAFHSTGRTVPVLEREEPPEPEPVSEPAAVKEEPLFVMDNTTTRSVVLFVSGIVAVIFAVWFSAPWITNAMNGFVSPPKSQAAETAPPAGPDYLGMDIGDLRKAALGGNPAAEYSLGIRYASGDEVPQDYHQALAWFLKAADKGEVRAAAKIATCFWAGKGTPQDYTKAYFWALLAQAAGDETGQVIVINSAPHLSDHRKLAEQQEADAWLRAHHLGSAAASRASR